MRVLKYFPIVLLVFFSCSRNVHKNQSIVGDPTFQLFLQGRKWMQQNELIQAEIYFDKALDMRPDFAPALNGLAQVFLKQGHLEMAEQYLQLALQGKPKWLPTRLTEIQILIERSEYELADQKLQSLKKLVFKRHLKLLRAPVLYYSALVKFKLNNLDQAEANAIRALQYRPDDAKSLKLLHAIRRKKKRYKKFPPDVKTFAFKPVISRADLAELIHRMFHSNRYVYPLPEFIDAFYPHIAFDKLNDVNPQSKQAAFIKMALEEHVMWAFPDYKFRPQKPMEKGAFALVLQRIFLRLNGDSSTVKVLTKRCNPPLDDVPVKSFVYPAVCFALRKGLIKPNGHRFNPQEHVSGEEAVLALQKLKALAEHASLPVNFDGQKGEKREHDGIGEIENFKK